MADRSAIKSAPRGSERAGLSTLVFLLFVSCCWKLSPLSGPRDRLENWRTVLTQVAPCMWKRREKLAKKLPSHPIVHFDSRWVILLIEIEISRFSVFTARWWTDYIQRRKRKRIGCMFMALCINSLRGVLKFTSFQEIELVCRFVQNIYKISWSTINAYT